MIYYLRGFKPMDYGKRIFRDLFFDPDKEGVIAIFREWVNMYEYTGMKAEWDQNWYVPNR